jgi:[acyl-carrier-protein] S-malonyltransferase
MSFAFVFPGQGSQSVGMLASLSGIDPVVRDTFDEASSVLGYNLWHLVQEGPAERLDTTEYTQPAMLAAGTATARLWTRLGGPEPAVVAGHSLGEFTALVCAGALEFSTAIALVKFRGQVMQEAVPAGVGAMAAILGLEDADVEAACSEAAQAGGGVVEPVNYNSAGQVVIAGEAAAVARAIEVAKARGAKKAIPLSVSVPSHSSLMNSAAERFTKRLAEIDIRTPRVRYVSAVDAAVHSEPADIRALLGRQLARPVRWTYTVRAVAAFGVTQIIECGPAKKLTGMNKRVEGVSGVTFAALEDPANVDAALSATKESGHA